MAIAECNGIVDQNNRERLMHGSAAFPVGCYHDDLQKDPVPWHWHDEFEAVVVSEGKCILATVGEKTEICCGEGFFINAGGLHGAWEVPGTGCRFHSLVFHPRLVGGSSDSLIWQKYVDPLLAHPDQRWIRLQQDTPWMKTILDLIERAWQACACEEEGFELTVRASLSQMLRLIVNERVSSMKPASPKTLLEAQRMKQMLEQIHTSYAEPITVKSLADAAHISESECLRSFKRALGLSPIAYVREYRLQKAAELIASGNIPVSQAATLCGFSDMSYFAKCFRKQFGKTPSAYRNLNS